MIRNENITCAYRPAGDVGRISVIGDLLCFFDMLIELKRENVYNRQRIF